MCVVSYVLRMPNRVLLLKHLLVFVVQKRVPAILGLLSCYSKCSADKVYNKQCGRRQPYDASCSDYLCGEDGRRAQQSTKTHRSEIVCVCAVVLLAL